MCAAPTARIQFTSLGMRPILYREENTTQEFVKRIDKKLVEINRVLAIKHDRIETDKDKKKFNEADSCWICK